MKRSIRGREDEIAYRTRVTQITYGLQLAISVRGPEGLFVFILADLPDFTSELFEQRTVPSQEVQLEKGEKSIYPA